CRGFCPHGVASISWRHTQAAVGLAVTLTCTSSRLPCAMNTSTMQGLERQRGHGEQVGRPEMVSVVGEEGAPALARRAPRSSPAVAPDRAIADHDAQLEQLASDPLGTPERVLAGHGRDEFSYPWPEMGASASRTRLPAPEQAPTPPM